MRNDPEAMIWPALECFEDQQLQAALKIIDFFGHSGVGLTTFG